ncbi:putative polysaccharide biosynthesis protein [Bacillus sp. T33-2]|uniref:putative polysaccharide biosynthesis protein n=1 Tax=Bacillus sp. T33-2 TaxID=2054168 RepID=UPI000C76885E|nr:polysaccharide biosynthesis protein [Bacillus sp. T33-2]PLR91902.1 polysaccharide biosynthesis protein [Bacillus sp. T33-2]
MKPVTESTRVVKGVFILTAAALVTKLLSAVYRVPFQNIVGDTGFYIYQQVYPFYGLVLVLSTYGFPVVISKLYTEQKETGNTEGANRLLAVAFLFLSVIGISLFCLFYYGAEWIAGAMGDPELHLLFRIIAFPFLLVPFSSVFRGYFQGKGDMAPTAVSQVGEQFVRVVTILSLSALFISQGYSLYYAAGGAAFGSLTGGLVSAFILGLYYLKSRDQGPFRKYRLVSLIKESSSIAKALAVQGFAISVSGMLLILMQMADSLNLYQLLANSGIGAADAKEAKGIYDRGQPLIQLGTVVATSMSLSLVPVILSDTLKNRTESVIHHVKMSLQISVIIGTGATAGLISIIRPANQLLFENTQGSMVLAILSLMILLGSVIITMTSVLQGLNYSVFPAMVIMLGFGLKMMFNVLLVPQFCTVGAAAASIMSMAVILLVLMAKLRMVMKKRILPLSFLLKVFLAALSMAVFLAIYLRITGFLYVCLDSARFAAAVQGLTAVLLGGCLYLLIIIKNRILSEQQLLVLPFGGRLRFLLPNRRSQDKS